jgi:Tol biopolymer transport system component
MTDREEVLGRALSALLEEQTSAIWVDTDAAARRLQGELSRASRERQFARAAAAAAVLIAAIVGALIVAGRYDHPPAPPPADDITLPGGSLSYYLDLPTGTATGMSRDLAHLLHQDPTTPTSLAYSPDGTRVAYACAAMVPACPGAVRDGDRLVIANADGTDPAIQPMPNYGASPAGVSRLLSHIYNVTWSPDGSAILYQRTPAGPGNVGNLFLLHVNDGTTTQITDLALSNSYWDDTMRVDFSPDGRSILFHLPRTGAKNTTWDVWSVPTAGGEPTVVVEDAMFPHYLADGSSIVYVTPAASRFGGKVIAVHGTDGTRTLLESPDDLFFDIDVSPNRSRFIPLWNGPIEVVDVASGEVSRPIVQGRRAGWVDDDTIVVTPEGMLVGG